MKANVKNRTIFTGDNLAVLRGMNSESVDLIYCDPPFNSNRNYSAPIGSEAAGAAFKDTWTLDDVDLAWHGEIAEREPALYEIISASGLAHSKSMMSYLIMMSPRLLEMQRILKPTGSIYLHVDPTASHYLKAVMDCVFGRDQFRNEITWRRTTGRSDGHRFGRVSDRILYYGGEGATWNNQYTDHDPEYIRKFYRHEDDHGRLRLDQLTAAGQTNGDSGMTWRGVTPASNRHWAAPGTLPAHVTKPANWSDLKTREKLDYLDEHGLVHWPANGGMPSFKRYLSTSKGVKIGDFWPDPLPVQTHSKEKTGYPTQKPLALLERIIRASSNPGDVVLDPFCGCATTLVAAEKLDREWIGADLSPMAVQLVRQRLERELGGLVAKIIHREDKPVRTDQGKLPDYRTHKHHLYGKQEGNCEGCHIHFPYRNMTVDHIVPRVDGGTDHRSNLQLLCSACNSEKGPRSMAEFRARRLDGILRQ